MKWKIKKYFKKITLGVIVISCITMFVIFLATMDFQKKFDKELWQKNKEKRYNISTDLINSRILIGKDTNEVEIFLESPNTRFNVTFTKTRWFYYLGESNFMLNRKSHDLIITFENSKVSEISQFEIDQ